MLDKIVGIKNLVKEKRILLNIWRFFFFSCVFLFLLYLCRNTTLHFDGAMNNEVAYNLAEGNGYATSYEGLQTFDHNIQTGAPVIIPTAILNVIFGSNYKFMQVITIGYLFFFFLLTYGFIEEKTNTIYASSAIIIMTCCPHVIENAYAGYGEMSMAVWMLIALFCFLYGIKTEKHIFFLGCGCAIGIGFLTKTVFLICAPAFLFLLLERAVIEKNLKKMFVRGGEMVGGAAVPVTIFESWKASTLGINEYIEWWAHEAGQIYWQTGVKNISTELQTGATNSFLDKIQIGLNAYSEFYSIPVGITILLYGVPLLYLIICYFNRKNISMSIQWFILMADIYFVWYVAIMPSNKLWARRCVVGHCFMVIICILLTYKLFAFLKEKAYLSLKFIYVIYMILTIILWAFSVQQIYVQKQMIAEYSRAEKDIDMLVEYVETLPQEADFYAYGWWRNSIVITENEVSMYDITETTEIGENSYLIVQYPQLYVEPDSMLYIVTKTGAEYLFGTETCYVYKLNPMTLTWEQ